MVGVVVDVAATLGACAAVEPPRHPAKARDRFADRGRGHAHAVGQRRRSHRILHIMKPWEAGLCRNLLPVHNQNEMLHPFNHLHVAVAVAIPGPPVRLRALELRAAGSGKKRTLHLARKLPKPFYDRVGLAINIQMVRIGAGDDRRAGMQLQKRTVKLVGLHHAQVGGPGQAVRIEVAGDSAQKGLNRPVLA